MSRRLLVVGDNHKMVTDAQLTFLHKFVALGRRRASE